MVHVAERVQVPVERLFEAQTEQVCDASDHHANPGRSYQSLRDFPDLPRLPNGYFGMYLLSYFPPLWFRVMDRRVLALSHVAGDLSRVNVDPRKRAYYEALYPTQPESAAPGDEGER